MYVLYCHFCDLISTPLSATLNSLIRSQGSPSRRNCGFLFQSKLKISKSYYYNCCLKIQYSNLCVTRTKFLAIQSPCNHVKTNFPHKKEGGCYLQIKTLLKCPLLKKWKKVVATKGINMQIHEDLSRSKNRPNLDKNNKKPWI